MTGSVFWQGRRVPFDEGQTLAAALLASGLRDLGGPAGRPARIFCGIGACQACAVTVEGLGVVEACLTPAVDGMRLGPAMTAGDHA